MIKSLMRLVIIEMLSLTFPRIKGKKDVQDKLDKISNEIDEAYSKYKSSIDSDSKSEEDKQKEKKSVNLIKIYLVLWIKSEMAINLKIVNKLKRSAKLATVSSNIS